MTRWWSYVTVLEWERVLLRDGRVDRELEPGRRRYRPSRCRLIPVDLPPGSPRSARSPSTSSARRNPRHRRERADGVGGACHSRVVDRAPDFMSYRCPFTGTSARFVAVLVRHAERRLGAEIVPVGVGTTGEEQAQIAAGNVRRALGLVRAHGPEHERLERAWAAVHATTVFCVAVSLTVDALEQRDMEKARRTAAGSGDEGER